MHKLFCLLAVLTIFNGLARAQGGSTCTTINIYCPEEQNFLDTVEAKLLKTITKLQNGEKGPYFTAYSINPYDGSNWSTRETINEIKSTILPKKYLPTYKYQLVINWDSTYRTGYILGFSKEYAYETFNRYYDSRNGQQLPGFYLHPFYHVPLADYKNFLTQKELDKLYQIIKKNFINYINVDTSWFSQGFLPVDDTTEMCNIYSDTSVVSHQHINLDLNDPLVIMPLYYWVNRFKDLIMANEIACYDNAWLNTKPMTPVQKQSIYERADTVTGENGNKVTIMMLCPATSIAVGEKWTFDTLNINQPYSYEYGMRVKRETIAIGVITHCSNGNVPTPDKIGWISYKDLDAISRKQNFRYYPIQLDNALFKKLNLQYYKY